MQYYFIKLTKHFDYDSHKCQLLKLLTIMKILEPISLYPSRRHWCMLDTGKEDSQKKGCAAAYPALDTNYDQLKTICTNLLSK